MRVGLTGGIGSGKTTIARLIGREGYPVYISDLRASELMRVDVAIRRDLSAIFGSEIYAGGVLDRRRLARIVFEDRDALLKLNAVVHPAVMADFDAWCAGQSASLLFFESAILFEAGLAGYFDCTVAVSANEEERVRRVCNRDGLSVEEVRARMRNQLAEGERCRRADYLIYTDRGWDEPEQVRQMIASITQRETHI